MATVWRAIENIFNISSRNNINNFTVIIWWILIYIFFFIHIIYAIFFIRSKKKFLLPLSWSTGFKWAPPSVIGQQHSIVYLRHTSMWSIGFLKHILNKTNWKRTQRPFNSFNPNDNLFYQLKFTILNCLCRQNQY